MAYALDDEEQFQSSWRPQQAQLSGGTGGGVSQTQAQPGAQGQSRFVSFDRYLDANREAAAKTGEKLGYAAQQQGDAAKQAMDTGLKDFGTAAIKGMGGTYAASQQPSMGMLPAYRAPATVQGNIVTAPGQQLSSYAQPIDRTQAAALAGTVYSGPRSLSEFAPGLQAQTDAALQTARNIGTEAGRRALLTEGMGRQPGAYSGAMAGLDEALASGVGNNRQRFQRTSDVYGKLGEWLGQRSADASRLAGFAEEGTKKQAKRFGDMLTEFDAQKPPPPPGPTTAERDAATEARNVEAGVRAREERIPVGERVTSVTDETAAQRYGDKVYEKWIAEGRPEFSSWIRAQKKR